MTEPKPVPVKTESNPPEDHESAPQLQKEKIRSVMEAASALTALGDEESSSRPTSPKHDNKAMAVQASDDNEKPNKRFLPEHKKPDAAPTFPEKLMTLMRFAEEQGKKDNNFCVSWLPEGKSFVIKNSDEFSRNLVPKFFKPTKFTSFTRKLYRWGFRQINRGIGPDDPIIFGNEYFVRDNEELMSKMRSITAASTRKAEQRATSYNKRVFDQGAFDQGLPEQKRFLFDHLFHQKANLMHQSPSLYGGMSAGGAMMPLSNALRPGGMDGQMMMSPGKQYEMMQQHAMPTYQGHNAHPPMFNMQGHAPMGYHQPQMSAQQQHNNMMAGPNHQGNSFHPPMSQGGGASNSSYRNPQSTAEIVNAAIQALRQAN